ncbi:Bug family tripartite tricarboxylate transporter substrate binding protein [Crenalkalicoccus roseus]|uniref:Bug family tripartite tricarboxylate transporter substrate binding protein n=1 Tax=Crenalkalicoccus roseus TaxID=1485588 RepID=UPI001080EBBE|nr:tripartite tricarboxylate transporter substrate binding protein [Crenalkalicoccus roseus]
MHTGNGGAPPGRRGALALIGGALAAPLAARAQGAQAGADWPTQPVRYINGFPPGGSTDILGRIVCAKLTEITGQQFVLEPRTGSGGLVGADAVAKSRPDGTTIGLGGIATHAISPTLQPTLPFHPERDFTFISGLWRLPNLLIVNNDLPARSVPELIALLKAHPGRYSYASAGPGTTLHLSGALLQQMQGLDIQHVPYRGAAPAMVDLIAGRVHFMMDNIPGALAQARQGTVRALAVTSRERSPVVPDLPSLAEFLPGFDIVSWTCLCGPAGLPPAMVRRMSGFLRQALESEDLRKAFLEQGATPWWTTPEEIVAFRRAEEARLRPIILASGARRD